MGVGFSWALLKVTLVESHEAGAVAGFVFCHFVNGVVGGVHTGSLGVLGNAELVLASALLGCDASLEVGLGVAENIAEQLSELAGVLCLLKSIALEGLGYLGIALAVGLTAHGKIHAYLTALAGEMVLKVFDHLLVGSFLTGSTENVSSSEGGSVALIFEFLKLGSRCLTDGAALGSLSALVDVTANGTNKLFLHDV